MFVKQIALLMRYTEESCHMSLDIIYKNVLSQSILKSATPEKTWLSGCSGVQPSKKIYGGYDSEYTA